MTQPRKSNCENCGGLLIYAGRGFRHGGTEPPDCRLVDGAYRLGITLTADKGMILGHEVLQFSVTNDEQGAGVLAAFDAAREALLSTLEPLWPDEEDDG